MESIKMRGLMIGIGSISQSVSWDTVMQITSGVKDKVSAGLSATGITAYGESCLQKISDNVKHLGCLTIYSGISTIKSLFQTLEKTAEAPISKKIENVFVIATQSGSVGESVSGFACYLSELGALTSKSITWTKSLDVASSAAKVIGLGLAVSNLAKTYGCFNQFKQAAAFEKNVDDYTLQDYRNGIQLIFDQQVKDPDFINEHFKHEGVEFAHSLMVIESTAGQQLDSTDPKVQAEGKRYLKTQMEALGQRICSKQRSHVLNLLINAFAVCRVIIKVLQ